jgi:hypothetical protein
MSYIKDILFKNFRITNLEGQPADLGGEITTLTNFDYFESIFSPTVTVTTTLVGLEQLFSKFQMKGTETLSFEIQHPSGTLSFDDLYVQMMVQNDTGSTSNVYSILFNNPDSIANYRNKLSQRYDPEVKISTHVESILKTLGTERSYDIEDTANSYGFFGNGWTPFKALYWLAKRSMSSTSSEDGSGTERVGFLFWETKSGYNFKSIDTIASSSKQNVIQRFDQSEIVDEVNGNNFDIFNVRFEKDQDILDQISNGMYSDEARYFNPHSNPNLSKSGSTSLGQNVNYGDKVFPSQSHFGKESKLPNYNFNLLDTPTFDTVQINSNFHMRRDGSVIIKDGVAAATIKEDNIHKIKSQARMRYASMLSRSLRVTVPLNFELQAGLPIELNLIESNSGTSKHLSGVYIIKDLRHSIETTEDGIKGFTHLRLLSDTYGKDNRVTTNVFS